MRQIEITSGQSGQRLDKFLRKYMKEAPGSFVYKMLRKKNITLNDKKADGSEKLQTGDILRLFLAEDTLAGFGAGGGSDKDKELLDKSWAAYHRFGKLQVLYEASHVLLLNKPAGILSQKASPHDLSLNEWLIGYLLARKKMTEESLVTFHPSVCNRLDRNTSGIVICGKSLYGSQQMTRMLKDRTLHKYYLLYVEGRMDEGGTVRGYLYKDTASNTVSVSRTPLPGSAEIVTAYRPLAAGREETLVEAELITGKTHQIRAHLASVGFPLTGDQKYGDAAKNRRRKEQYGISHQLLHAYRIVFPQMEGELSVLSGMEIEAPVPKLFSRLGCRLQ